MPIAEWKHDLERHQDENRFSFTQVWESIDKLTIEITRVTALVEHNAILHQKTLDALCKEGEDSKKILGEYKLDKAKLAGIWLALTFIGAAFLHFLEKYLK